MPRDPAPPAAVLMDEASAAKSSLTRRYVVALGLVGGLAIVAFVLLSALIEGQKSAGAIVNASGRRRYSSQRIVLFSSVLVNARTAQERTAAHTGLKASIDLLEKNHLGLISGNADLRLSGHNSPEVNELYFDKPTELDARLHRYIDSARKLDAMADSALSQDNAYYRYIIDHGPTDLIRDLELAVNMYQKESEADVGFLHNSEMLVLAVTLLLLVGEGLVIFRPMTRKVVKSMRDVQASAAEVKRRSATIQTIYDNVKSGFLLIDKDYLVQEGFSRSCHDLLGAGLRAGEPLTSFLAVSERDAGNFRACVGEVFADIMPEEVMLDQVPKNFSIGGKSLRLVGSVIRSEANEVQAIMFTISDITAQVAAEERNHFYETMVMILQQKDAFMNYLVEMKGNFATCRSAIEGDNVKQARFVLHTMKGNSAAFGLTRVANLIHELESKPTFSFAERNDLDQVEREFKSFINANASILQISYEEEKQRNYLINSFSIVHLQEKIASASDLEIMRRDILSWLFDIKKTPFENSAKGLKKVAEALAVRLEKEVVVETFGGEVMIDAEYLMPVLQNFIHVVRNSVDHGIETAGQRRTKPATATIRIGVDEAAGGMWRFTIADDGRGIDTEKLVAKAVAQGMVTPAAAQAMTRQEQLKLVFAEGVSTAEVITEISGRGVGMSAALAAVSSLGGSVDISSERDRGTSFYIFVPMPVAASLRLVKAA